LHLLFVFLSTVTAFSGFGRSIMLKKTAHPWFDISFILSGLLGLYWIYSLIGYLLKYLLEYFFRKKSSNKNNSTSPSFFLLKSLVIWLYYANITYKGGDQMELKDFISNTLISIKKGLAEANTQTDNSLLFDKHRKLSPLMLRLRLEKKTRQKKVRVLEFMLLKAN